MKGINDVSDIKNKHAQSNQSVTNSPPKSQNETNSQIAQLRGEMGEIKALLATLRHSITRGKVRQWPWLEQT